MNRRYYYSKSTILLLLLLSVVVWFGLSLKVSCNQAKHHREGCAEKKPTSFKTADQYIHHHHHHLGLKNKTLEKGHHQRTNQVPHLIPNNQTSTSTAVFQSARQMLVTGAAGFIGFHLSKKLALEEFIFWTSKLEEVKNMTSDEEKLQFLIDQARSVIIGLDNFNDYYSTDLKYLRRKHFEKAVEELNDKLLETARTILPDEEELKIKPFINFEIIEGDVCNVDLLRTLFEKFTFTHVVHMAAQAGVRYSLKNPQTYIRNNIMCQIELLETIVKYQKSALPIFLYASSSSVYGNIQEFDKSAFHEGMNVNKPTNVYSASKIAQELFAETYNYLYGIPVIGLRFFTVYGPYGRPDMALFTWVDQIVKNRPITLYTTDGDELMRDFTYVDDIVHGIVNSMQYGDKVRREEGRAVHEVFNLGNHKPERVINLIRYIEKALDKKAVITHVKKPPTDMTMTFADIEKSQQLINFEPKTSLENGVKKFVDWYLDYYHFSKKDDTDDVIFTTYFVTKKHPERDEQYGDSCFAPMKEWYDSVHKLNLRAVVFYDEAELYTKCEFNKWTSYNVRFELVTLGNRSTNDERFFVYEEYLENQRKRSTTGLQLLPKRVLMTDLFDIRFNRNPFDLMLTFEECNGDTCSESDKLFIGSEPTTIIASEWAQQKLKQCDIVVDEARGTFYYNTTQTEKSPFSSLKGKETSLEKMLLNPGIVGGPVENIMHLLKIYNEFLRASPASANCNTPVFNILMYQHEEFQKETTPPQPLSSYLISGQPLHTVFKAFDESDSFYIKHK